MQADRTPVTGEPVTPAPVTSAPSTQPPVAQPPVAQPPGTQPPGTQPPGTAGRGIGATVPTVAGNAQAPALPVARVVLDVPLAHLDRPFDYSVPPELSAAAVPGARVVARFAGRQTAGFIVERVAASHHAGALTPLARVVSPVPVLAPEVLATARAVADHYAGSLSDVLRLAVPPRHARVEASVVAAMPAASPDGGAAGTAGPGGATAGPDGPAGATGGAAARAGGAVAPVSLEQWTDYEGGAAFLRRLAAGEAPRAVWTALPGRAGRDPRAAVAAAVAATVAGGRGALVVVPEAREVAPHGAALTAAGVEWVRLTADEGPAARYRAFLQALLGQVRVVVGTRAAAFAPVRDLGLVVLWDDGDDLLAEPRAPYPHARMVLQARAEVSGAGALLGGHARSVAAQQLLEDGWARAVGADRATVRARAPRVAAPDEADLAREGPAGRARIPHVAVETVRAALEHGPVLVQVPRAGYVAVLTCARCREAARCGTCHGPLRRERAGVPPACSWCGRPAADWSCPVCGSGSLRNARIGSDRTAEELGRAFPGVPVQTSGSSAPGGVLDRVDPQPRLVVATPGAEPVCETGYAAALLLDAAATSSRPELWAGEEALRRWLGAAALVRGAQDGGRVLLLGGPAPVPAQALVRWDPAGFAAREFAERRELAFPPAWATASVEGDPAAVASFLGHLDGDLAGHVLGPVPVPAAGPPAMPAGAPGGVPAGAPGDTPAETVRAIVRLPRERAGDLSRALRASSAVRSARKESGLVRVRVDPVELW